MQSRPSLGVDDTVTGITSLFLDGARLRLSSDSSGPVPG